MSRPSAERYLARSGGLLGFDALVREAGHDPEALLRAVGLPVAALQTSELYLSYPRLAELLTLAAGTLRMPDFGLRLGQRQGLAVVGALGAWLCAQETVAEALAGLRRHLGFHVRGLQISFVAEAHGFGLVLSVPFADRVPCRQLLTLSVTLLVQGLNALSGRPVPPRAIQLGFPAPPPETAAHYQAALLGPVRFGGDSYRVDYDAEVLLAPVRMAPALRARLIRRWRDDTVLHQPLSLQMQTARAITALLPTGRCSLADVAALVERHPRTLQQDLKAAGTHFGEVLRQVRQQLACTHLADSDIDLTRLASDLGYADLSAFSRAFRQWTGRSPRQWRARPASH